VVCGGNDDGEVFVFTLGADNDPVSGLLLFMLFFLLPLVFVCSTTVLSR